MRAARWTLSALLLLACAGAQDSPFIKRHDKDGDGKVSREEAPPQARELFDRVDTNHDGYIDAAEDKAFRERGQRQPPNPPPPSHANLAYGPHERNVVDLWLAKSDQPTPLLIFFHGGGFRGGDKRQVNVPLLQRLAAAGISTAAANYRLTDTAPFPAQMHDAARCVQFLRLHAEEYNLDKSHFAAMGGSAGAGISQWLALHDDLADPNAADPAARESTRLSCAIGTAAQTTYDPRKHREMFGTDGVEPAMLPFYGLSSAADADNPKFWPLFEEASPVTHLSADDPPIMLVYTQPNTPLGPNPPGHLYIHHPMFGKVLQEPMTALGLECVVRYKEDYEGQRERSALDDQFEFLVRHLKPKA